MLNAHLLNAGVIKFESYTNYQKSLKDIWKFIDKYPKLKDAYTYTINGDRGKTYGIRLRFQDHRYHLIYNTTDKKYTFQFYNNESPKDDDNYF